MYGETLDAFRKANLVWVELLPDSQGNRETWAGKILDAQDSGFIVRVLSVNINGRISEYVERDNIEVRFVPIQQVRFVTVREEES